MLLLSMPPQGVLTYKMTLQHAVAQMALVGPH